VTLASLARVKKEPDIGSLAHVKKEPGVSPSSKKARHLTEYAMLQLEYQAPDDPEEFRGLKAAELASFNEVQPGTMDFALAWSRRDAKKADAEQALRLGLCVNLDDDNDAGLSQRRGGNDGQGCSAWVAKDEAPSDDDGGGDYKVFYRRLGMQYFRFFFCF
jgi:hypothetical protein